MKKGKAAGPLVSDRVLVDLLKRSGFDTDGLRTAISDALSRSHAAAQAMGSAEHLITIDQVSYVMRDGMAIRALDASYARRHMRTVAGK